MTTPAGRQLYSVVTGSFENDQAWYSTLLNYPEKRWNTVTTTGENNDATTKRVLGLGDPRKPGQQTLAPLTDVKFGKDAPQSAPQILAPYFDAAVGLHPTEVDEGKAARVTIGTRNSLGYWNQPQDKAYIMVSEDFLDASAARTILTRDFKAMSTVQFATDLKAGMYKGDATWERGGKIQWCFWRDRHCPSPAEVLAIYAAP